jgi:hypothetical protein
MSAAALTLNIKKLLLDQRRALSDMKVINTKYDQVQAGDRNNGNATAGELDPRAASCYQEDAGASRGRNRIDRGLHFAA